MLGGKKAKTRRETWQGRVYEFDEEKLKRIFKKYSCSFGNKFTSLTSLKGVAPLKNEAQVQEKVVSSQNMQQLVDKENKNENKTPSKVMKLVNSFPSNSLEELALQAMSVTRLTNNFGVDTCKLCKAKSHSEW